MKEIVIAQPLGITEEMFKSLSVNLEEKGFHLTAYDTLPKDQEDL